MPSRTKNVPFGVAFKRFRGIMVLMSNRLTNIEQVEDSPFGVCLWELDDGKVFDDGHGRALSAQGKMRDPRVEEKMRKAAISYGGRDIGGHPIWVNGARKVSDSEHDDQTERLLEGKIPDPVDQAAQLGGK